MRINSIAPHHYTSPKNTSFAALPAKMKEKNELNKMAPTVRCKADEIYQNVRGEKALADEKVNSSMDRLFEIHTLLRKDYAENMKIEPLKFERGRGVGAVSIILKDIMRTMPNEAGNITLQDEEGNKIVLYKQTIINENSYSDKERILLTVLDDKNPNTILEISFSNSNQKLEGTIKEKNPDGSCDKISYDGYGYANLVAEEVQKNYRTQGEGSERADERFVFKRNGVKEYYKNWAHKEDDFVPSIGHNATADYGFKFHFDNSYVKVTGNSNSHNEADISGFDKYFELIGKRFRKINKCEF